MNVSFGNVQMKNRLQGDAASSMCTYIYIYIYICLYIYMGNTSKDVGSSWGSSSSIQVSFDLQT